MDETSTPAGSWRRSRAAGRRREHGDALAEARRRRRRLLPGVFERLARGDRGDPQEGGDYQSLFDDDFAFVDTSRTAQEVHTQVGAWRLSPIIGRNERGPILERDGERIRLLRSSLTEVERAERLDARTVRCG